MPKKLQQNKEKKLKLNRTNPNWSKTISEKNETKKIFFKKKKKNADKQERTCSVCKSTGKENQIDWFVCRIYTVCGHADLILGIHNTWSEIIH